MSSQQPRSDRVPTVMSIAGSDSGGGAGIQADLKAFARCGVHGTTAITAITWQNTVAVTGVTPVPPEAIIGQVEAVVADIRVDAVKIGMLGSVETIAAVERSLDLVGGVPLVLDPVMVAQSGAPLLEPDAVQGLIGLLGRATVVTPNTAEARRLTDAAGRDAGGGVQAIARSIGALGPQYVVVTGGHADTENVVDVFWDGSSAVEITGPRYPSSAAHGSGCTHSSVLAAQLALGRPPLEAAREAARIAAQAVRDGLDAIGSGDGPVNVLGLGSSEG